MLQSSVCFMSSVGPHCSASKFETENRYRDDIRDGNYQIALTHITIPSVLKTVIESDGEEETNILKKQIFVFCNLVKNRDETQRGIRGPEMAFGFQNRTPLRVVQSYEFRGDARQSRYFRKGEKHYEWVTTEVTPKIVFEFTDESGAPCEFQNELRTSSVTFKVRRSDYSRNLMVTHVKSYYGE